jgi:hypothetical protein
MVRSHSSRSKQMEQRESGAELVPRLVRCAAVLNVGWRFLPFALLFSLDVVVTIASGIVATSCYRVVAPIILFVEPCHVVERRLVLPWLPEYDPIRKYPYVSSKKPGPKTA